MIKYVDDTLENSLSEFVSSRNVFACRIACLLKSYGTGYDFADFYIQLDGNERPTAAAVKYYSDMTIMLSDGFDRQEILEFIGMTAPASVLCPETLVLNFPMILTEGFTRHDCVIMKRKPSPQTDTDNKNIVSDPPLKNVWQLLKSCENDGLSVPAYEDFLPDMSHKLRHGTASIRAWIEENILAGAAMTVAQSESCALIGAVAAAKQFRRQGIGSACMNALCSSLYGQGINDIFIVREPDKNEAFYTSLGFENYGKAVLLVRASVTLRSALSTKQSFALAHRSYFQIRQHKSFAQAFSKACRVQGRRPCSLSAESETLYQPAGQGDELKNSPVDCFSRGGALAGGAPLLRLVRTFPPASSRQGKQTDQTIMPAGHS